MARKEHQPRPVLVIERSPIEIVLEVAAAVGVVLGILIVAQAWSTLLNTIPLHFGISGKPDSWVNKWNLWLFPLLCLAIDVGFLLLSRYPQAFNYPYPITEQNAPRQYQVARLLLVWLKTEIIWLFAFVDWEVVQATSGNITQLNMQWFLAMLLLIFGTVGFYLRQAYLAR